MRGLLPPRTDLVAIAVAVPVLAIVSVVPVAIGFADYGRVAVMAGLSLLPALTVHRIPRTALALTVAIEAAHVLMLEFGSTLPHGVDLSIALVQPVPLATAVVAGLAVLHLPRRTAWVAPIVAALALAAASYSQTGMADIGTTVILFDVVLMGAGVGGLARAARERGARRDAANAEHIDRAVAEERLRIARDLHDVLAHQLTLINAQAGVAEYLLDTDPAAARTALSGIARHTSEALDEVRATVGMMRMSDDSPESRTPVPTLDDLPALIESYAAAGATVTLEVDGPSRRLGDPSGLALYRIVQEALTNAAKHAPDAAVAVELTWWTDTVAVRVENARPARVIPGDGTGAGLIGMAERARALGGTLATGPTGAGGFAVEASLPCPPVDTHAKEATP